MDRKSESLIPKGPGRIDSAMKMLGEGMTDAAIIRLKEWENRYTKASESHGEISRNYASKAREINQFISKIATDSNYLAKVRCEITDTKY